MPCGVKDLYRFMSSSLYHEGMSAIDVMGNDAQFEMGRRRLSAGQKLFDQERRIAERNVLDYLAHA